MFCVYAGKIEEKNRKMKVTERQLREILEALSYDRIYDGVIAFLKKDQEEIDTFIECIKDCVEDLEEEIEL